MTHVNEMQKLNFNFSLDAHWLAHVNYKAVGFHTLRMAEYCNDTNNRALTEVLTPTFAGFPKNSARINELRVVKNGAPEESSVESMSVTAGV
ncbi:hypothetical protein Y032_0546g3261 [Ancylostoma ceylanicum]|uniref:Uncharacterized protein n=1 Tax=Ancylostoma ceylanicum TaxID=53326 RepID=A0A016WQY9_9BILA|nr:hypothetical protein Y032_0546g3261 [Ancylostoma ceylanicum]